MAMPRTSAQARDILETFRRATGIRPNLWARAALGYSLSLEAHPEEMRYDSEGTEFQEKVFFGADEGPLLALLRQRIGSVPEPEDVGTLIKAHVERGLRHFDAEFQRLNRRGDEFLLYLIGQSTSSVPVSSSHLLELLPPTPEAESFLVRMELGTDLRSGQVAEHVLNGPGSAPHVAIMGRNGTGKTRTGLQLLSGIRGFASYPIPFLIFDYAKGDIASNQVFADATESTVISMPDDCIPLAPLSIPARDEHAVQMAARRFRDTICSIVRLGAIQKDRCLSLIRQLYYIAPILDREQGASETPDLSDLTQLAEQEYELNAWNPDSLLACLREFSAFPLFRTAAEGERHDLFQRSHIIDLHRLPEELR